MKLISLTQGKFTKVDNEKFEALNQYVWSAHKIGNKFYATRHTGGSHKTRNVLYMHREILGLKKGDKKQVDHIDMDGLNNLIINLRVCDHSQNRANQLKAKIKSSSRFKGVSAKKYNQWEARISHQKKVAYLGLFNTEIGAAIAYNKAALEIHGEFARLNKI